jgi:hypothetical protein
MCEADEITPPMMKLPALTVYTPPPPRTDDYSYFMVEKLPKVTLML